jgi:hypothetical protein
VLHHQRGGQRHYHDEQRAQHDMQAQGAASKHKHDSSFNQRLGDRSKDDGTGHERMTDGATSTQPRH